MKQSIGNFKYHVGIRSLAEIATRADRVCVLSRRPGRVREIIDIPIPRADRAKPERQAQLATLGDVMAHYNKAPAAPAGHSELRRLNLRPAELAQIEAFLRTLSSAPRVR